MKSLFNITCIFLLVFLFACQDSMHNERCLIYGNVKGDFKGHIKLMELGISEIVFLDSASVDEEGSFQLEFTNDSTNIFALQLDNEVAFTLIIGVGDTLNINIDLSCNPEFSHVNGNQESSWITSYEQHTNLNLHKIDSLRILFEKSQDDPGFFAIRSLIDQAYQEILIDQQVYARGFIEQHPGSIASLVVLNRKFKQIRLFDEYEDFNYYSMIDTFLLASYPGNKHAVNHHEITEKVKKQIKSDELMANNLSIGKEAPDMTLQGWNAQSYQLSDLRGNLVILYFWAAMDARSRKVNQEMKAFYSSHKDKGLEIFAVSFDNKEEMWKSAIKLDQLDWIHVSDLKGTNSPVIKLYQVPEKLPYLYLLDHNGIIIFKGHNYGELEEILITSLGETS